MSEYKLPVLIQAENEALLPSYATEQSAGADVRAHLPEARCISPGERMLVPTGIRLQIPPGYEVQVRPRSGLAFKHGITVLNTPGTIDADYRGEICVLLINLGQEPFWVEPQMRIGQLVFAPVLQGVFSLQKTLSVTSRGEGGFGHTGVH